MRTTLCRFSVISILLVLASTTMADQRLVGRIEIEGNDRVSDISIKARMETKEGRPLLAPILNRDIRRLYESGEFAEVRIERAVREDEVDLIIYVKENPVIAEVLVIGDLAMRRSKALEAISARPGEYLRTYVPWNDERIIRDMHREKGYRDVEVSHTIIPGENGPRLIYRVQKGRRYKVGQIIFEGNHAFTSRHLKKSMKTKKRGWFRSGKFIPEVLDQDLLRIATTYRYEGWVDAKVTLKDLKFVERGSKKMDAIVTIAIDEGRQYTIDEIVFLGNKVVDDAKLLEVSGLATDTFFSPQDLDRATQEIRNYYGDLGYYLDRRRHIAATPTYKDDAKVALTIRVIEGAPRSINEIQVRGNQRTKEIVIRREFVLNPGDEFNLKKLDKSINRVRSLGYFQRANYQVLEGPTPDTCDVLVSVDEGRTGNFNIGAGVSTDHGIIGNISLRQSNFDWRNVPNSKRDFDEGFIFVGDGQSLTLQAQPGTERQLYRIAFSEPWIFDRPYRLDLSAHLLDRDRYRYVEERGGGTVGLGKRIGEDLRVSLAFRHERIEIEDLSDDAPLTIRELEGTHYLDGLGPTITYSTLDNAYFTTEGLLGRVGYEWAGNPLGGDLTFQKVEAETNYYIPLFENEDEQRHVLALRAKFGWAGEHSDGEVVPVFERFFAGGSGSVRGFDFRTISPKEDGDPIGGDVMALAGAEYSFPIYADFLRGACFFDAGNVAEDMDVFRLDETRTAAGFGIRLRIPALGAVPVSFDYGVPLQMESDDDEQRFSFSFGGMF